MQRVHATAGGAMQATTNASKGTHAQYGGRQCKNPVGPPTTRTAGPGRSLRLNGFPRFPPATAGRSETQRGRKKRWAAQSYAFFSTNDLMRCVITVQRQCRVVLQVCTTPRRVPEVVSLPGSNPPRRRLTARLQRARAGDGRRQSPPDESGTNSAPRLQRKRTSAS